MTIESNNPKQSSSFVIDKILLEMVLASLKSHQLDDFTIVDLKDQDRVTLKVYSETKTDLLMLEAELCTLSGIDLVIATGDENGDAYGCIATR